MPHAFRLTSLALAAQALFPLGGASGLAAQDAWPSDTARVVFAWTRPDGSDLWLGRCGSDEARRLTTGERANGPDVSPDGTRLVYVSMATGQREVILLDLATGTRTNLTNHPDEDLLPRWSPDGRHILFFSTRGEDRGEQGQFRGHLYTMAPDGSQVRRLTGAPLSSTFGGSWSPDGSWILFARRVNDRIDLHALELDGAVERRLATLPGDNYGGSVSPDGTRIAFHSVQGEESRIVVAWADGSDPRELTSGRQDYGPMWSPDGRWLLFTSAPLGASRFDIVHTPAEGGVVERCRASEYDERDGIWAWPRGGIR